MPLPSKIEKEGSEARATAFASLPEGSTVHIIGICGTGTASVASLCAKCGYRVQGSDKAFYPPMDKLVNEVSTKVFSSFSAENLTPPPAAVIIGNSIRPDNPEAQEVLRSGLQYCSMPEALRALLIGSYEQTKVSVVVAGTHGKTTTSAALAVMLSHCGEMPGYFIGGVPKDLPGSIKRSTSDGEGRSSSIVVLEGDEYDSAFFAKWPKFLAYRPDIVVVTSIEFDHADIYGSLKEIDDQFEALLAELPSDGTAIVCCDDPRVYQLVTDWKRQGRVRSEIKFYGESEHADIRLLSRKQVADKQRLEVQIDSEHLVLSLSLSGLHNALNALACLAVAREVGVELTQAASGLEQFSGVLRRQDEFMTPRGVLLIEDFAHHPTAVARTLGGLRERYPSNRILAVYEPRSNTSRRHFFQKEYAEAFKEADRLLIREVVDPGNYSAFGEQIRPLNVQQLVADVTGLGVSATSCEDVAELAEKICKEAAEGDLVVVMSNGDFGGLLKMLKTALA